MIEDEEGGLSTLQTHLVAAIADCHTWLGVVVHLISDLHYKGMYAPILALNDHFSENKAHIGNCGSAAHPELHAPLVGGVDHKAVGGQIISSGSDNSLHIGPVGELGERESTQILQRGGSLQKFRVLLCAENMDGLGVEEHLDGVKRGDVHLENRETQKMFHLHPEIGLNCFRGKPRLG